MLYSLDHSFGDKFLFILNDLVAVVYLSGTNNPTMRQLDKVPKGEEDMRPTTNSDKDIYIYTPYMTITKYNNFF